MEVEVTSNESKIEAAKERIKKGLESGEITQKDADDKLVRIKTAEGRVAEFKKRIEAEKVKIKSLDEIISQN